MLDRAAADPRTALMNFPTVRVQEGAASILVPELATSELEHLDRARSRAPVFYNPRMRLNRDSAILALGAYRKRSSRLAIACEPFCGTGVRGIRLALEVEGVEKVVLGDMNQRAVELTRENASLNGVSEIVAIRLMEANLLLSLHARPLQRFDYIDIDPYGSPAPFLDAGVRACRRGGLIALTATDMAPLCGVNPRACLRKYGGHPLRTEYSRELALRLLTGALVTVAARHETEVRPMFGYVDDHYVRLYAMLERGARGADQSLADMGYVLHCFECSNRKGVPSTPVPDSIDCEICGSRMRAAGPLWIGELAEEAFCGDMLEISERSEVSSNRRLMNIISLVKDEIDFPPGFYSVDDLCSRFGTSSIAKDRFFLALRDAGFRVVETHIDKRGFRTDAKISDLEQLMMRRGTKGGGRSSVS